MATYDEKGQETLQQGQLWRIEHGFVYIVEPGNRFIRYKILRQPATRRPPTQIIGIEALLNFLRQTEAQLVGRYLQAAPATVAAAA